MFTNKVVFTSVYNIIGVHSIYCFIFVNQVMEWIGGKIEMLIEWYSQFPFLFDAKQADYHNKIKRIDVSCRVMSGATF